MKNEVKTKMGELTDFFQKKALFSDFFQKKSQKKRCLKLNIPLRSNTRSDTKKDCYDKYPSLFSSKY